MKKKNRLVIVLSLIALIVVAMPVSLFYVLNNGNPITKYIADKKVPVYLEEMGYTDDEIKESRYVEPKQTTNRKFFHGRYMVIFKDEPTMTYYYGITKIGNKVKQFCEKDKRSLAGVTDTVKDATKHSNKECTNSR